jgi:general secretion pathway protein C
MPERLNLPRVATLTLALAIGLQLAWIVTGALGSHDLSGDAGAQAGRPVAPGAVVAPGQAVIDRIVAARLFGDAPAAAAGISPASLPPTPLPLVLAGVFAREDPSAGRAIIGESAAGARLHAVGSTLTGGARLVEVYPDRVILERAGQREALSLPRSSLPPSPAAPSDPSSTAVADDPGRFIRWQAMLRDGQVAGVRVYPGEQQALFTRTGLRPGDLIVAVNDSPLTDQATAAQFLRMLAGAPSSVVTVERDGRTENLQIDLAALGQAAVK